MLLIAMAIAAPGQFFAARGLAPDSFYAVIPLWAMQIVGLGTFGFSLFALGKGAVNFWKDAGAKQSITISAICIAAWDAVTLKNLGGGGDGCNNNSEAFSMRRRYLHHAMAGGFMLCFAATTVGFFYHTFMGWAAPYPFISVPVLLGTVGGVLLVIGTVGLFAMKLVEDPMPVVRRLLGGDVAMLVLLAMSALTGLLLLAVRATGAMGIVMAIHLGFILALFLVLPYSKMVHGVYRSAALLRRAVERNMKPLGGE
jgi:citrate/tricarballylate utilization protein